MDIDMKTLFNPKENPAPVLSLEEFSTYHRTANVISVEAMSDYLMKLKDVGFTFKEALFDQDSEKASRDATSSKFEVQNRLTRMTIVDLKDEPVLIPEGFSGMYTRYLSDLTEVSTQTVNGTIELLNIAKMAIAGFINEYREDMATSIHGFDKSNQFQKQLDKNLSMIKGYFSSKKVTTKTEVTNVIRSISDIPVIYRAIPGLTSSLTASKLESVSKLAKDVGDMVDHLVEQNNLSGVLVNNSTAKKELVAMIGTCAKGVEACGYLYANSLQFYTSIAKLSEAVIRVSDRK